MIEKTQLFKQKIGAFRGWGASDATSARTQSSFAGNVKGGSAETKTKTQDIKKSRLRAKLQIKKNATTQRIRENKQVSWATSAATTEAARLADPREGVLQAAMRTSRGSMQSHYTGKEAWRITHRWLRIQLPKFSRVKLHHQLKNSEFPQFFCSLLGLC